MKIGQVAFTHLQFEAKFFASWPEEWRQRSRTALTKYEDRSSGRLGADSVSTCVALSRHVEDIPLERLLLPDVILVAMMYFTRVDKKFLSHRRVFDHIEVLRLASGRNYRK